MTDTMISGNRFGRINQNAYWANAHLDTKFHIDTDNIEDNLKHIKDCIENPTRGLLAAKKHKTTNYPDCYTRNYNKLLKIPSIKKAVDNFDKQFNNLYPKTAKARKFLINNESIKLDYVKPIKHNLKRMFFKLGLICRH